ncbi:unnamed protein product [Rotaria sp. Silwood1]|nr:unnamed protein product [Rotaria sp. Silwood1]
MIICFAAVDQYMSTSMHERRQAINLKCMHRLIVISIFLSILYGIPFLVFYDIQPLSGTNTTTCRPNDNNGPFSKYVIYVSLPVIDGFIPIFIMSIAGFIAFLKVRTITKRKVHIIRLRLEQQLTAMVVMKILGVFITIIPFLILYIIRYIISWRSNDSIVQEQLRLVYHVFTILFFINYAVSQQSILLFFFDLWN